MLPAEENEDEPGTGLREAECAADSLGERRAALAAGPRRLPALRCLHPCTQHNPHTSRQIGSRGLGGAAYSCTGID